MLLICIWCMHLLFAVQDLGPWITDVHSTASCLRLNNSTGQTPHADILFNFSRVSLRLGNYSHFLAFPTRPCWRIRSLLQLSTSLSTAQDGRRSGWPTSCTTALWRTGRPRWPSTGGMPTTPPPKCWSFSHTSLAYVHWHFSCNSYCTSPDSSSIMCHMDEYPIRDLIYIGNMQNISSALLQHRCSVELLSNVAVFLI